MDNTILCLLQLINLQSDMCSATEFLPMKLEQNCHFYCASPKDELFPRNIFCGYKKVQRNCMIAWGAHAIESLCCCCCFNSFLIFLLLSTLHSFLMLFSLFLQGLGFNVVHCDLAVGRENSLKCYLCVGFIRFGLIL